MKNIQFLENMYEIFFPNWEIILEVFYWSSFDLMKKIMTNWLKNIDMIFKTSDVLINK